MKITLLMYRKEILEMIRNYKLLWIPVVFVLLGVTQPLTSFYLPDLLQASGQLPAELVDSFPVPGPAEVMLKVLSQYSLIGILLIVIAGMNLVAGELSGGTAALVLVRPVKSTQFIIAKWAGYFSLVVVSFVLSYGSAWYYTSLLQGTVPWREALAAGGLYLIWFSFAVSLTMMCSTVLRGSAAAVVSLLVIGALSLAHGLVPSWLAWSPAHLLTTAAGHLAGPQAPANPAVPIAITLMLCILFIAASSWSLRRQGISD
ncbi:ABC-2 type transport system permease protein [Fontibacillus phaseoli]|uniref:ABC-2 type transport system permease protein n=1 Tax=Fontibacillus phaseoli TaxID=1416533 RepID=A0A369AXK6_9BACL|nr:ABC transporter permease subunit [Fontibacillus phaseoli]RCX13903.1 ABC-2 type transport system permease protein [Fontibacillus phaseoli]